MANVTSSPQRLVNTPEVAEIIGCSIRQVPRLVERGQIPKPVRLGRLVKWNLAELQRWIDQGCEQPGAAGNV